MSYSITNNLFLVDQDMAASFNSKPIYIDHLVDNAIQVVYTDAPVGTFKLQASNDEITYVDIANSAIAINGPGSTMWNYSGAGYLCMRVAYTATSGSGVVNGFFLGKGY